MPVVDLVNKLLLIFISQLTNYVFNPFYNALPKILLINLDVTKFDVILNLNKSIGNISILVLIVLAIYFYLENYIYNILGLHYIDYFELTLIKIIKGLIGIRFSIYAISWFLKFSTLVINYFAISYDTDLSKLWIMYKNSFSLFDSIAYVFMIFLILIFYIIFVAIIVVRLIDLSIIVSIFPLVIPFYIFIDRQIIKEYINVIIGVPLVQLSIILCIAFSLSLSGNINSIKLLGTVGKFIMSLASLIYAIFKPSIIANLFRIDSMEAINIVTSTAKTVLLAKNFKG